MKICSFASILYILTQSERATAIRISPHLYINIMSAQKGKQKISSPESDDDEFNVGSEDEEASDSRMVIPVSQIQTKFVAAGRQQEDIPEPNKNILDLNEEGIFASFVKKV